MKNLSNNEFIKGGIPENSVALSSERLCDSHTKYRIAKEMT